MPKSVPSPNNLHAPDAKTNTIVPGNIDPFLHLSAAWSLFSFSRVWLPYKARDDFTLIICGWWQTVHFGILHNDDNILCSFQIACPTQFDLLHGELAFTTHLRGDACTQLHSASPCAVFECCGGTHTFLYYTHFFLFLYITVRQLYWFLKKLCMRVVILVMYFNSR